MTLFPRESLGVDRFLYDDLPRLRSATGERGQEKRPQPTCRSLTFDTCNKTRSRLRCLCSWLFILFMVFGNKTRAHTHLYTLFFISWTLWLFFWHASFKTRKTWGVCFHFHFKLQTPTSKYKVHIPTTEQLLSISNLPSAMHVATVHVNWSARHCAYLRIERNWGHIAQCDHHVICKSHGAALCGLSFPSSCKIITTVASTVCSVCASYM